MFRIKPTRNQTTAKHANLSPYPNNQLLLNNKLQPKLPNKIPQSIKDQATKPNPFTNYNHPQNLDKTTKCTNQLLTNNLPSKPILVNNPQKTSKPLINPVKNLTLVSKNPNNPTNKQPERVLLKRTENHKQHKLNFNGTKKPQIHQNLPQKNQQSIPLAGKPLISTLIKRKQSAIGKRKQSALGKRNDQPVVRQQKKQTKILKDSEKLKQDQINIAKHENIVVSSNQLKQEIIRPSKSNQVQLIIQKDPIKLNHPQIKIQTKPVKSTIHQQKAPSFHNTETKDELNSKEQKQEEERQRQKQTQQLMLKIQKRRQARQLEKKRLKQIEQKRKENEERALEFINARNHQDNHINLQQNQGVTGMLKLNDQLMHFSLAETIMDLQIKKLLKTNFDQFPNKSQIQYQIDEIERINLSYEMIRDDPNNPLRNGLQNYRVQIFNKIGDLIMEAQQGGFSNPNFHILEHDGRLNQGPNSRIPQAVRGLPQQSITNFIKYEQNEEQDECTICLGEIKVREICASIECRHRFHSSCINEWVKSSANCPTCRFNIKFGRKVK